MEACLAAGAHYIDIGGLFVETVKQVKYHERFKEAGLLAIIGIGGTPGLTNVCAAWAASRLDSVDSIDIACGCNDWSGSKRALDVTYAIETIMDEFYMKPIQFIDGEYREVAPRSGGRMVSYAPPIGEMYSYFIMHSEIGTLPEVYKSKGIRRCTFRIGFPDEIKKKLEFLHTLGFSRSDEVDMGGVPVVPVRVLKKMMDLQPEDENAIVNDCDIIRTEVVGFRDGAKIKYELEAICRPVAEWPELMGAQVYIGGAPAWAAELIRTGDISGAGAFAPEECIPPVRFFEEAAKREIYITVKECRLLGSDDWEAAERKQRVDQRG
jgi:saccharopine dehydrogenase (NAD+, L-lysine-forming)